MFLFYFDYCSFTGFGSVSLQVTSYFHVTTGYYRLLQVTTGYFHGFIMMSSVFKTIPLEVILAPMSSRVWNCAEYHYAMMCCIRLMTFG